ncbi:MAG: FkbM family methyltransferase [Steroidobacteraceae bacterium]|jgi:FkbM family methyltransferase
MQIRVAYRRSRVLWRQLRGTEPVIPRSRRLSLEFHGTDYGGWPVVPDSLSPESVVVDIGLGEDISFSESLITKYGCRVYGFDPTPKSIDYVRKRQVPNFSLIEVGVAARAGRATFYLPNNAAHVSGSMFKSAHVGEREISVPMVAIDDLPGMIGTHKVDLLKLDIEGAEFDLLDATGFGKFVANTKQICIEFHHRWPEFGKSRTIRAVKRLTELGFAVAWVSASNEEVLLVRDGLFE